MEEAVKTVAQVVFAPKPPTKESSAAKKGRKSRKRNRESGGSTEEPAKKKVKARPDVPRPDKNSKTSAVVDGRDELPTKPAKKKVKAKSDIPRSGGTSTMPGQGEGEVVDGNKEQRHSDRLQGKGRTMYLKNGGMVRPG